MKISFKNNIFQFLVLSSVFFIISFAKYNALNATFFDLGQLIRNFHLIYINDQLQHAIPSFSFIKILLSNIIILPDYLVIYVLLIIQSILLALPIFFFNEKYFQDGIRLKYLYIFHFSVWYFAIFDFHVDIFVIPLYCLFFLFLVKKYYLYSFLVSLLFLTIKDIYILQSSILILLIYIDSKNKNYIFVSLLIFIFFLFVVFYIQPISLKNLDFQSFISCKTYAECSSIKLSEFKIETLLIDPKKIIYISILIFSFFSIKIVRLEVLLLILPFLIILMLTKNSNYFSITNHYVLSFFFPLFFLPLKKTKSKNYLYLNFFNKFNSKFKIFYYVLIFNFLISPIFFSLPIFEKNFSSYSYKTYFIDERSEKIKSLINKYIPRDKSVILTTQNNLISNRVIFRTKVYSFPENISNEVKSDRSEFILVDLNKRPFLIDKTCKYKDFKCKDKKFLKKFNFNVKEIYKNYNVLVEYDNFIIFKHK